MRDNGMVIDYISYKLDSITFPLLSTEIKRNSYKDDFMELSNEWGAVLEVKLSITHTLKRRETLRLFYACEKSYKQNGGELSDYLQHLSKHFEKHSNKHIVKRTIRFVSNEGE